MPAQSAGSRCLRTLMLFALTGFLSGFIGPMLLSPDSNLGPIIGILFSGPAGAVVGAGACLLERLFPRIFTPGVVRSLAAVLALVTLYHCFPEPKALEREIDGEVIDCRPPQDLYAESLEKWKQALAGAPQARPLPDWQERAQRNVEGFDAVAVTLQIERSRIIFERRRPWERGQRFGGPWYQGTSEERTYFASASSCADWRARGRGLYWPVRENADEPIRPAVIWPPVDAAGFLMLQELGLAPDSIRALPD